MTKIKVVTWSSVSFRPGIALILSFTLLGTLLGALTGCRLGDRIESPVSPATADPDLISGYYLTLPQKLVLYATISSQANTLQVQAPVSNIPGIVSNTMGNPVALVLDDLATRYALLATPTGRYPFPLYANEDYTLSGSWSTTPQMLWTDPLCQSYLEIGVDGRVLPQSNLTPPTGFKHLLSGRIQVRFEGITKFQGDCTESLKQMASCYRDSNQCGDSDPKVNMKLQDYVIATFGGLIRSQLISPSEIPLLTNSAFVAEYQ